MKCKYCNGENSRNSKFCSTACFNKATKETPISGYKKCLFCNKEFPYKETAKVRSSFCKRLGMMSSVNQKYCSQKCALYYRNTFENPAKTDNGKMKISKYAKERGVEHMITSKAKEKQRNSIMGNNHWNWQGGKTNLSMKIRNSFEYKKWRKSVFERDSFTCQECGVKNEKGLGKTVKLNADHIKQFAYYPELRFELSNGRTLCLDCHKKTDTFAKKKVYPHPLLCGLVIKE